jgi:hypothetical protein
VIFLGAAAAVKPEGWEMTGADAPAMRMFDALLMTPSGGVKSGIATP